MKHMHLYLNNGFILKNLLKNEEFSDEETKIYIFVLNFRSLHYFQYLSLTFGMKFTLDFSYDTRTVIVMHR